MERQEKAPVRQREPPALQCPLPGGLITLLLRLAVPIAPNGGNLLVLRFASMWGNSEQGARKPPCHSASDQILPLPIAFDWLVMAIQRLTSLERPPGEG